MEKEGDANDHFLSHTVVKQHLLKERYGNDPCYHTVSLNYYYHYITGGVSALLVDAIETTKVFGIQGYGRSMQFVPIY